MKAWRKNDQSKWHFATNWTKEVVRDEHTGAVLSSNIQLWPGGMTLKADIKSLPDVTVKYEGFSDEEKAALGIV